MGAWRCTPSVRQSSLASLRQRLKRGPVGASVEKVTEEDTPIDPQFEHGFSIEYDG